MHQLRLSAEYFAVLVFVVDVMAKEAVRSGELQYADLIPMATIQSALVTTRRSGSMTSERVVSEARYSFCRQGELPSTSMLH